MKTSNSSKEKFPHRKLEVYKVSAAFFVKCWTFADRERLPDYFMRSQFLRAALSIKLNIAEGASEDRTAEKVRIYRLARRSAGECAAFLDDLPLIAAVREEELTSFYDELLHISNMLSALMKSVQSRPEPLKPKKRPK